VPSADGGRVTGRYRRQPGVAPVTVSSRHRLLPPPSVTVTTVTAYVLVTASPRHISLLDRERDRQKQVDKRPSSTPFSVPQFSCVTNWNTLCFLSTSIQSVSSLVRTVLDPVQYKHAE
jgi:hypothetical protein